MQASEQATEVPPITAEGTGQRLLQPWWYMLAAIHLKKAAERAYFDRQVSLIEWARSSETVAATAGSEPKKSTSEALLINTALQESPAHRIESGNTSDSSMEVESAKPASPQSPTPTLSFLFSPPVQFLKAPRKPTHYSTGHRSYKPKNPDDKVTIADTVTVLHPLGDQLDEPTTNSAQVQTPHMPVRPTHASHEPRLSTTSGAGEGPGNDCESDIYASSTMEDALISPKKLPRGLFGETSSDTSCSSSPVR